MGPMSYEEFSKGVPGDCLVKVFEDGKIVKEENFIDIQGRAKITKEALMDTVRMAVDNLTLKMQFLQKMSSDEAIAVRLAEASCGSKWKHDHPTHLAEVIKVFPKYDAAFKKIGIKPEMKSLSVMEHIKKTQVCDKPTSKKIFRALEDGEPQEAIKHMGTKACITL